MNYRQFLKQAGLWSSILIPVGVAWWVLRHYQLMEVWIRSSGWWGPYVAIGLFAVLSLTPVPSDPLTILSGALYGWGWGFLISWVGNTVAALVEYLVFRDVQAATHFDSQKEKLPEWLKKLPVDSPWFLIGVRFVPGFGGKVVSITAGMYKIHWWRFLWTALVANFVGALMWAVGGWGLFKII